MPRQFPKYCQYLWFFESVLTGKLIEADLLKNYSNPLRFCPKYPSQWPANRVLAVTGSIKIQLWNYLHWSFKPCLSKLRYICFTWFCCNFLLCFFYRYPAWAAKVVSIHNKWLIVHINAQNVHIKWHFTSTSWTILNLWQHHSCI